MSVSAEPASRKVKLNIARHAAGYVARHILRSAVKSLLCAGLALLLAGTVGTLTVIRATNESAFDRVSIKAHILSGIVSTYAIQLHNSGMVAESYFEKVVDLECNSIRTRVIMTNDIARCSGDSEIEFLEGYSYKSTTELSNMPNNICVMDSNLMDMYGVALGDKVPLISEFTRTALAEKFRTSSTDSEEEKNAQMERFSEALKSSSIYVTIIGKKTPGKMSGTVYVPISSGNGSIAQLFSTENRALDIAEYTLSSPSYIDEFRELAGMKIIGTIGGIGSPFVMDTSEADNLQQMLQMLSAFYTIAIAAGAVLGGLFPGLIVMLSAREAAMMRALGMPKRRTRVILLSEQAALSLLGLILSGVMLFAINGPAIVQLAASLALIFAVQLAACVIGALICAVSVTMRRPLELLQVKE